MEHGYIVGKVVGSLYEMATLPKTHMTLAAAQAEANRLAIKEGETFVVFQPVTEHAPCNVKVTPIDIISEF